MKRVIEIKNANQLFESIKNKINITNIVYNLQNKNKVGGMY